MCEPFSFPIPGLDIWFTKLFKFFSIIYHDHSLYIFFLVCFCLNNYQKVGSVLFQESQTPPLPGKVTTTQFFLLAYLMQNWILNKKVPHGPVSKIDSWYSYCGLSAMNQARYSDFFKTQSRHQTFTLHYMKDFIV